MPTRIDDYLAVAGPQKDKLYTAQRVMDVLDASASVVASSNLLGYALNDTSKGGAPPTGVDDTTAIEAVFANAITDAVPVIVPVGTPYHYNGSGINNQSAATTITMRGGGRNASMIIVGASSNLFVVTNKIARMGIMDLTINGGVNQFSQTLTTGDSTDIRLFENVAFINYTSCAVQNNVSDGAFWHFRDCWFDGLDYVNTMGVALSGLTDTCVIDACMFHRNRVNLKVRHGGPNMKVTNSEFIRLTGTPGDQRVNIWVVPHNTTTNAGIGMVVKDCKFGGERLVAGDMHILYADELAGASNGAQWPDLTGRGGTLGNITSGTAVFTDSTQSFDASYVGRNIIIPSAVTGGVSLNTTIHSVDSLAQLTLNANASATVTNGAYTIDGWITGHQIKGNMFANANSGAGTAPFVDAPIYTTTRNLRGHQFRGNYANGASFNYAIHHTRAAAPDAFNNNNYLEALIADNDDVNVPATPPSNMAGVGYSVDPTAQQAGTASTVMPYLGGAFSYDFKKLFSTRSGAMTVSSATKQADLTDSLGGTDAAEYSIDTTTGLVTISITKTDIILGKPMWMQFGLKQGSTTSLSQITFLVKYGGSTNHFKRTLELTPEWIPHLYYFTPREALANVQFQFTYSQTGRFQIERPMAYHSRNPVILNAPVLMAQDGSCWKLLVDAAGVLSTAAA